MHSRLSWVIRQLRTPPDRLVLKLKRRVNVAGRRWFGRLKGRVLATYRHAVPAGDLGSWVRPPSLAALAQFGRSPEFWATRYLEHRFDLLGSGLVKVAYGEACLGFGGNRYSPPRYPAPDADGEWLAARINPANLGEAKRIWRLVDHGYEPIDWQRDFKSGYRWGDATWHCDIEIPSDRPGADIKVPWELARCQHLPQLALFYAAAEGRDERYTREFRNQVLDFIANNPPGYGVNWRCTMDVSIRIANWLIGYDLFVAAGAGFDADFRMLLLRSAMEHARHIIGNLEWSESGRSNHYLSNVVGLLIVSSYLPSTKESDAWAGWALREFMLEVEEQFDAEGCNREGSTSYHRLSSEMAIYGAAFGSRLLRDRPGIVRAGISGVPGISGWDGRSHSVLARVAQDLSTGGLPPSFWRRLHGMGKFVTRIAKPNGCVPQVGDNDSGRFLRLHPGGLVLDHRHLPGALTAFIDDEDFSSVGAGYTLEAELLRAVSGIKHRLPKPLDAECRVGQPRDLAGYVAAFEVAPPANRQRYEFARSAGSTTLDHLSATGFREFGLFVLRGSDFYLAFRCGPATQYGQGSHLHHDQLSIELVIGGADLALDPGTYVYTPLPDSRNAYRSLRAHFAPWPLGVDDDVPGDELFEFRRKYRAECVYFQADGVVGRHFGFGGPTYRVVCIEANRIVVLDYSEAEPLTRCPFAGEEPQHFEGVPFSDQYGGLQP